VVHPVGERQWEDISWNGQGHCMCVNMVLGPFVDFCTPAWFTWAAKEKLHALWTHWVLRQYADQGSF
jgi:hypothetical protein